MSDFLFFSSFRRALNNLWERIPLSLNHCSVSNAHCQLLLQEVQHHCTSSQMKKGWWRKLVKFKNLHLPFIVQLELQIRTCTHLCMYTPNFLCIQPDKPLSMFNSRSYILYSNYHWAGVFHLMSDMFCSNVVESDLSNTKSWTIISLPCDEPYTGWEEWRPQLDMLPWQVCCTSQQLWRTMIGW